MLTRCASLSWACSIMSKGQPACDAQSYNHHVMYNTGHVVYYHPPCHTSIHTKKTYHTTKIYALELFFSLWRCMWFNPQNTRYREMSCTPHSRYYINKPYLCTITRVGPEPCVIMWLTKCCLSACSLLNYTVTVL